MPVTETVSKGPNQGFLARAHNFLFYLSFVYVLVIALLATPFVQRHAAFQHALSWPRHIDFTVTERFGFAPGKTANLYIQTPDNVTLGTWFILSEEYYQTRRPQLISSGHPTLSTIQDAIRAHPTVLYLHGASRSRAAHKRVQLASGLSSRLHTNVFVIDYRGFGESSGIPSEDGLAVDAHAAWTWLLEQGAKAEDVLILGHSLGTGVSGMLATRLATEGVKPRGVVLLAPFTALATLVETYDIWGFPVLQPLQSFSWGRKLLKRLLRFKIDTLAIIQDFNVDILIAHSENDDKVPYAHSRTLVDRLLDPLLPPSVELPSSPGLSLTKEEYNAFTLAHTKRKEARSAIVTKSEVPSFGIIETFEGSGGKVVYVEAFWGQHEDVGLQEGVQDEIAKMFRLGVHRQT